MNLARIARATTALPYRLDGGQVAAWKSTTTTNTNKRMWTGANDMLVDHKAYVQALPGILGAYVGPAAIEPKLNESIMVTVNSACEGLHGQLARMAGVEDSKALNDASSVEEACGLVDLDDQVAITFAREFAESDGEQGAYEELAKTYGEDRAKSIKSLCLFLHWGSLGGNTLNDSLSKLGEGGVTPFRLFYVTYYGPLFGVIAVMNAALPIMPRVPSALSAGVGVVLTFVGGSWLAPVGLAGLAFGKE
jgi:hypothetical protein